MAGSAIGLIETKGLLGAIVALDAALKAAQVRHVSISAVRGGRINFVLGGEVAAVTSAVDAGCEIVKKLGCLRGRHVIPRPAEDVERMLRESALKPRGAARPHGAETCRETGTGPSPSPGPCDALEAFHTTELRRMLRDFNDGSYGGREISRMRKEELLEIIRRKRTGAGHGEKGDAGK